MPIGAPKVAFEPGDDEDGGSWVDLYNRLYEERILILGQEINSEVSNQLVGVMVYLGLKDETKDINLFINSPGGDVVSGMALFDGMQFARADVKTICLGVAASMAAVVLTGGESTKRIALPHSKVMIHQPISHFLDERFGDSSLNITELIRMYNSIIQLYAQRTGQQTWKISEDLRNGDYFMTAEEAQAYGIVDMVGEGQ